MEARDRSSDSLTKLVPGASHSLAHLSDSELLTNTRCLAGKSNQVFAALLQHLAEVEARGIHRTRRCSSLYTYCIYELRLSEDAAARRASAAKLVSRFPALLDAIAAGELHLTGLLMLGPHLTDANHLEVMAHAKFRTKKEIAKLVRTLAPLPQVPDRIEPLGPEPRKPLRAPTWEQFVTSFAPAVRELPPGERPQDWANDTLRQAEMASASVAGALEAEDQVPAPARVDVASADAPVRVDANHLPPLSGPQLYQMQFTTTEEHAQLIERARALLSHQSPRASLGELHLQAMRLLVAMLEKKRFAVGVQLRAAKPDPSGSESASSPERDPSADKQALVAHAPEDSLRVEHPRQRGGSAPASDHPENARQRSRHLPAAVRRTVFERDGGRCTYVDERGQRCRETHLIQIHHLRAFAQGGPNTAENLALRCVAHNALAAEEDFGREHVVSKRDSCRHDPRARYD